MAFKNPWNDVGGMKFTGIAQSINKLGFNVHIQSKLS